jgi:hypothetical protein
MQAYSSGPLIHIVHQLPEEGETHSEYDSFTPTATHVAREQRVHEGSWEPVRRRRSSSSRHHK